MPTLEQIEAARRNGSKSKGPNTPEGKRRSSLNAVKHGLTAAYDAVVLHNESEDDFHQLLESCIDVLQPADALQLDLVREIATLRWRLRRACSIQTMLLEVEMERDRSWVKRKMPSAGAAARITLAFESLAGGSGLQLCLRYETTLRRSCERALRELRDLQQRTADRQQLPTTQADPGPAPQTKMRNEPNEDLSPAPPTRERTAAQHRRSHPLPRHRRAHR